MAMRQHFICAMLVGMALTVRCAIAADQPSFDSDIVPLLNKYCAGCHNPDESNGKLDLTSFEAILRGGEHGLVLTPGSAASSRLAGVLTGQMEPAMPPIEEAQPSDEERDRIVRWIESGAPGPIGQSNVIALRVPKLPKSRGNSPVTALDIAPGGKLLAIGRFESVELRDQDSQQTVALLQNLPGKVNDVRFSADGSHLIMATGIEGLRGDAVLWEVATRQQVAQYGGHRDVLYAAAISPDQRWVATAGYDRVVILHDRGTGQVVRKLQEHNGAVFDLAFSADSRILVTASADATVKVWDVETGVRLDTRSEPLKEQLTAAIHPSGKWFVGAGSDNRIRAWELISRDREAINPLVHARFAHDGAVERVRFSRDGGLLASAGRDLTVKVWNPDQMREIAVFSPQPAAVQALALDPRGQSLIVGRMDGSWETYPLSETAGESPSPVAVGGQIPRKVEPAERAEIASAREQEPNGTVETAQALRAPTAVDGVIDQESGRQDDFDLYAFDLQEGERWIVEVAAARNGSLLDSYVEVWDDSGRPVPRVMLQAVRDSYFSFRLTGPNTADSIRFHHWEEMRMGQYLYANGEVVRLWHYPRGPDSGFGIFPSPAPRHTQFDTTPIAHPMGEVCYIVEPRPVGTPIIPNGLPVFPIYFENDDDGERKLGTDSRLTLDVPRTGRYLIKVRDARNFHGSQNTYQLRVRPPAPGFEIHADSQQKLEVPRGSGIGFDIKIVRTDGFDAAVRVDVQGVPAGFHVTTPIVVEPEMLTATGMLWCDADAAEPSAEAPSMTLVASSESDQGSITLPAFDCGRPTIIDAPQLAISARPADGPPLASDAPSWPIVEVRRGGTASISLSAERRGHEGRIEFGGIGCIANSPYGVYVANLGLSAVLIPEGQTERKIVVIADSVTAVGDRTVFFRTKAGGGATSNPLTLRVLPDK